LSDLNTLPDRARQALAIFGHIDVLINNGGISNRGDVLSTDAEVFMRVMVVNYFGQMVLTKGKFMKQP
jgi:dehydrogenase/reductase SDR family protein 7B